MFSFIHTATHTATYSATHTATHTATRTATHCNTLQHTLQHTATHCIALQHTLQHTATHHKTLRHTVNTATHCNTLQHIIFKMIIFLLGCTTAKFSKINSELNYAITVQFPSEDVCLSNLGVRSRDSHKFSNISSTLDLTMQPLNISLLRMSALATWCPQQKFSEILKINSILNLTMQWLYTIQIWECLGWHLWCPQQQFSEILQSHL